MSYRSSAWYAFWKLLIPLVFLQQGYNEALPQLPYLTLGSFSLMLLGCRR